MNIAVTIIICIHLIELGGNIIFHDVERKYKKYNAFSTLFITLLMFVLYYYAGLF